MPGLPAAPRPCGSGLHPSLDRGLLLRGSLPPGPQALPCVDTLPRPRRVWGSPRISLPPRAQAAVKLGLRLTCGWRGAGVGTSAVVPTSLHTPCAVPSEVLAGGGWGC